MSYPSLILRPPPSYDDTLTINLSLLIPTQHYYSTFRRNNDYAISKARPLRANSYRAPQDESYDNDYGFGQLAINSNSFADNELTNNDDDFEDDLDPDYPQYYTS